MPATTTPTGQVDLDVFSEEIGAMDDADAIEEVLNDFDFEWHVSDSGTLSVKMWQVAAEGLFSPAVTSELRERQDVEREEPLNWVSEHMEELRQNYAGQWIAVGGQQVVAHANSFPELLDVLDQEEREDAFVTSVPEEPVTAHMTFGASRA